ncbi:ribosomal-protein-alanine N-acetyltransferase [bacterium]|jgi:ribosomal-protein-alanine N-acetyltransferase|nr:ribosomal-protein-alanine N-acetyltransferase [bacterium]
MDYSQSLSLRPAVPEDLPRVLEIEKESHGEPWGRSAFEGELQLPYSRFLVLTDDETDTVVLGYIIYHLQAEGVSLLNVTLAPKWRNLGLSRILLSAMVSETVREEIPRIILEVRESNSRAIAVYGAMGFAKTHERKQFYSNGETAWVMELRTSDIQTPLQ